MIFRQLFHQETCTYTYLLADEGSVERLSLSTRSSSRSKLLT